MAILTVSGTPASRFEEVAHGCSQLLGYELITESRLSRWMTEEFGETPIPERAWLPAATSIVARMALEHHLVLCVERAESLFPPSPFTLRAQIVAPEIRRISPAHTDSFDLMLNGGHMDTSQMAEVIKAAAEARALSEQGFLTSDAEAQIQFDTRLKLARHRIVPGGQAQLRRAAFGHPSEEVFANLLDFYRIAWEYEPRSFPLQWDKDGRVIEAFTPDFYLPEFDLYVELTTMKQTLVTRKNRKIKMLRGVYPHINIQVFYQKDFQDLVFKHGLKAVAR